MRMFFPSTYPSSRKPWRKASIRAAAAEGVAVNSNPIRGILVGCCACAETQSAKSTVQSATAKILRFTFFSSRLTTHASQLYSLDHSVRSCQHVRWNYEADLLGSFKIDDQLELGRLLHGKIGGL